MMNAIALKAEVICPMPSGLAVSNVTMTTALVSWAPTQADSFLVRYYVTGSSTYLYVKVRPGTATSVTLTGLYPMTNYTWAVHGYCNGGASSGYQSTPGQFTTLSGTVACVTPNNTSTTSISTTTALLSWNSSITADSFLIRYAPRNSTNYSWVQLPGSAHSYVLTSLVPGTAYEWRVKSICAGNPIQSYSIQNVFNTLSPLCGSVDPYYFNIFNIDHNSAMVTWQGIAGVSLYNVRYAVRFSNNWTTVSTTATTKALTNLLPSTWYEFQIQALCAAGPGIWTTSGIFQTSTNVLSLTRGPYLQLSTTSSIYIRWRTGIPSDSRVKFGTSATSMTGQVDVPGLRTEHQVQLTGLVPNTKYFYTIGSTTVTLQGDTGNYFRTNPVVGSTAPVRIWTIGDFGVASNAQAMVRDAYANYVGSANTNIWLWVGDNAYLDGTDAEYTTNVFNMYPYQMKKYVIWPATGNHDLHSANAAAQTGPYFDNFTLPKTAQAGGLASNTEAYYSFNYANIHFVCLESTDAAFRIPGGAQATWLANDLAANTQRWTIVYFHHPPYSKGSHDSDTDIEMIQMRTNIIPILEGKKVDLVLSGHSHSYERSMMIKGHYGQEATFSAATMAVNSGSGVFPSPYVKSSPTYNGTVYVVCGVSGKVGGTTSGYPHNAMYTSSISNFGSLVIDVIGDRLDCKFLNSFGSVYDQFTIQKIGAPFQRIDGEQFNPAFPASDPLSIFPNPLADDATIRYILDENSHVIMEVTDLTGRVLYTMMDGEQEEGQYEITLRKSEAILPGGVYFIRLIANDQTTLRKFVVTD